MKRIVLGWVCVVAIAWGIMGGAASPGTFVPHAVQSGTPDAATPVTAGSPYAVGVPFRTPDDAWELTVTSAGARQTLTGAVAKGIFVVVALDVTNTSPIGDVFPYSILTITDNQGQTYERDPEITDAYQRALYISGESSEPPGQPISPGDTAKTAVVFDVPVGTAGVALGTSGWPFTIPLGF